MTAPETTTAPRQAADAPDYSTQRRNAAFTALMDTVTDDITVAFEGQGGDTADAHLLVKQPTGDAEPVVVFHKSVHGLGYQGDEVPVTELGAVISSAYAELFAQFTE